MRGMSQPSSRSVGIVGARGHVGTELIRLVARHPGLRLAFVSSRELAGQSVAAHVPEYGGDVHYAALGADDVARAGADAVILALPNGLAAPYVAALDAAAPATVVVDVSADYRFDAAWHYGLPELQRDAPVPASRRLSNPGCYATAMQLAIAPRLGQLAAPMQCFGVSGYSGAGTSPTPRNDPARLRDNLMPYALTGHLHEREVSHRLAHAVEFMPHVAAHFRGLMVTCNLRLATATTLEAVRARYREYYAGAPLVAVQDDAPWVSMIAGRHGAIVGGFSLSADGQRLVVVAVLDNLLKGAATQAMQNLNRALGFDEYAGIPLENTDG
jgi:N-acetyl-gamma-glutamyl-phosphate reductase common form